MIFTKNKEGVRAIRTRTFGAEVHKSNIFESKDNTIRMKIVN